MKTLPKNKIVTPQSNWGIRAAGMVLALFASAMAGWGNTVVINQFNSSAEVSAYQSQSWNGSPATFAYSGLFPSYGSGSAGSMAMSVIYSPSQKGPGIVTYAAPFPLVLQNATFLEFDLMVPANSDLDPNGNAGFFQLGFQLGGPSYSYDQVGGFWFGPWGTNFTPGVWQHFKLPIPSNISSLATPFNNIVIDPYDSTYTNAATNIIYIDNIEVDITPPGTPHFPNLVVFDFDNSNSVTADSSIAGTAWYGQPTTLVWATNDSTLASTNITPAAGSGSMHIAATFGPGVDNSDVFALALDTNYFVAGFPAGENNTNYIINGYNYDAIEFDILWDTNASTMPIDQFNAMGDIAGAPIGLFTQGNGQVELNSVGPSIPDGASNGWVHMVVPMPNTTAGIGQILGLWGKKYGKSGTNAYTGVAAYYIDNVVFDGGVVIPPSPKMTIQPAVKGLNALCAQGSADRESVSSFAQNLSWIGQTSPVTYTFNIAQFPSPAFAGFDARLYLVPNINATESDPDWVEPNLGLIQVYLNGNGLASVEVMVKTNAPNDNGNLYSQDAFWNSTNSPAVGNWSFTFTNNTNVLITAPDGETASVVFPLNATDLQNIFGSGMVIYLGGFPNGSANQGQNMIYHSTAISNGATTLLSDNFATDTVINPSDWIVASSGAPGAVFLTAPTTAFLLQWSAPAAGFFVQTNGNLLSGSQWSTNEPFSPVNLGSYYQQTVDVTNLPASGSPLYFRLNNNPTH